MKHAKVYSKRKRKPALSKNLLDKRLIYPLFLISFIIFTLYLFFLGENGFYSHKIKLELINVTKKENMKLSHDIIRLKKWITQLEKNHPTIIEKEGRKIPLKKRGDIIIKLYHSTFLEEMAKSFENKYSDNPIESESEGFFHEYKIMITIMLTLLIAYLLTLFFPFKKKEPPLQNPIE